MKKKNSLMNKIRFGVAGLAGITIVGSATLFLTACSDNKDILTTDDLVSTGNGTFYTSNGKNELGSGSNKHEWTIKDNFEAALQNRTPLTGIIGDRLNAAWLSIIDNIISKDKNDKYRIEKQNHWKKIDTDYSDLVKNLKESNPDDWEIILQRDTLDPNGGTEEAYKNKQKLSWASSYLTSRIFEKSYLRVRVPHTGGEITKPDGSKYTPKYDFLDNPTKAQIFEAANNFDSAEDKPTFVFDSRSDSGDPAKQDESISRELLFANIQQYVFDMWMKIQQPFVVNMSLWKYSSPKEGIDKFYTIPTEPTVAGKSLAREGEADNSSGSTEGSDGADGSGTSTSAASYIFPYFQNGIYEATNDTLTTVKKFQDFVEASKTQANFLSVVNDSAGAPITNNLGLIDIPQQYTEDSSTYILAKRETIFTDLYPEFAAGAISLLEGTNAGTVPTKAIDAKDKTRGQFDTITSNFISDSASDKAIKVPAKITEQIINPDGNFKSYYNKDLYSLDAFKIQDASLNNFMLLRNEAGVHAIAIDGGKKISDAANSNEKIEAMKFPILYRSMMSYKQKEPIIDNPVFNLDIKSELQTFFNGNTTLIMTTLLNDVTGQPSLPGQQAPADPLKDMPGITKYVSKNLMGAKDSNEQKLFALDQRIAFIEKMLPAWKNVEAKFEAVKSPFNEAYGTKAYNNGFAAPWVYEQEANGDFKISATFKQQYGIDVTDATYEQSQKIYREHIKQYLDTVKAYVTELDNKGAFVKKMIKYSQVIWANMLPTSDSNPPTMVDIVNSINYSYTSSNSIDFANVLKNKVMEQQLKPIISKPIDPSSWTNATTAADVFPIASGNNIAKSGLDINVLSQAFFNYASKQTFDKLDAKSKFANYTYLMGSGNGVSGTTFKITKENLQKYKNYLYIHENRNPKQSENEILKNSIYSTIGALDYVLRDNGKFFINYVQNKLTFGNDAFVVWEDRFNSKYDKYMNDTSEDALNPDNRMIINNDNNINASYLSYYTNTNADVNDLNVHNDQGKSLYGVGDAHYEVAANKDKSSTMLGYKGFQSEASNTLGKTTSKKLFQSTREVNGINEHQGILYKYGSKETLIEKVKEINNWSQIKQLIDDINKDFELSDMDKVDETKTPEDIKKLFEQIVNNQIPEEAFKKFDGYLTDKPFYENAQENTFKSVAYAEQINYEDLRFVKGADGSVTDEKIDTLDKLKTAIGDNLFYTWLIEAAYNGTNQSIVTNKLASDNKFLIYDINAKNALGSKWVENWLLPSELKNKDK